ncbi:PilZ domain-containing protein [Novosphingobium kunmingense]|uniref:PilZ domain-containing protein n=1 Tax=Novosphingobium kunmingense TaxID=1211806 RepID=A0A2N0I3L8_9SPHN|nr:PilZ domain-containing protein [Novosphingobium kunmingense]PKB25755.1 PilZ domain-containing protein [Novosphingobium kunmingense]
MGLQRTTATRGQRHFNRLRLGVPAALIFTHGRVACLIDDISCTGARLRSARAVPVGQTAQLAFHELRALATVRWVRGTNCGLEFDRPLAIEKMQDMLWINENRALYDRIAETGHARDWADGIGD